MNLLSIPTGEVLEALVKNLLPSHSGQNTILEVDLNVILENKKLIYIKVCFWRPNNYVLVGYNTEEDFDFLDGKFQITANHDSTWKQDGLSFMNKVSPVYKPIEVSIKTFGLKNIYDTLVDDDKRIFTFKYHTPKR